MNFSISSLLAGFLFGIIGLFVLKRGRANANFTQVMIGLALMIYPYFVNSDALNWGLGIALTFAAYWLRQ